MKQETINRLSGRDLSHFRLALVVSRFNETICESLLTGALTTLEELGFNSLQYDVFRVPGVFEIPVVAKKCALSKKYQGVVCLGAVIRGETPHFDYLCQSVSTGLQQVALDTGIPVGFGLITANNPEQAKKRAEPGQFNKGREAVLAVLEVIDLLQK